MKSSSCATVVALVTTRSFFTYSVKTSARLHFNGNVEAVDDRNIIKVWTKWYQSELNCSGDSVQTLVRRTKWLVVAEGRSYQASISRVICVEFKLPAPICHNTVPLSNRLIGSIQRDLLSWVNRPVIPRHFKIEIALVVDWIACHARAISARHLCVTPCWGNDHRPWASVDDINAPAICWPQKT